MVQFEFSSPLCCSENWRSMGAWNTRSRSINCTIRIRKLRMLSTMPAEVREEKLARLGGKASFRRI